MPVSKKRKKKTRKSSGPANRASHRAISSFDDLTDLSIESLTKVAANDLDTIGLANWYTAFTPARQLNQCVTSCVTLQLAMRFLGRQSEIVPAVLEIPWADQRWGTPDPQNLPGDTTDGHVVLITNNNILLDPTAAQFNALAQVRNGLPIIGRDPKLWSHLGDPAGLDQNMERVVEATIMLHGGKAISYMLYHPYRAAEVTNRFIERNRESASTGLESHLTQLVQTFVWIVANVLLVGSRAHEIDQLENANFARHVRAAAGQPQPEILTSN